MILAIDIGNTGISLGLCERGRIVRTHHCENGCRDAEGVLETMAPRNSLDGAVLGSVAPKLNARWIAAVRSKFSTEPLIVSAALELGVEIDYPRPEQIGADRLANASGACHLFGAPVVVADFGTALTFDIVASSGAYVGGVIAPGLPLMFDYLAEKTELLPHLALQRTAAKVGKSTAEAMQIGARRGYCGMVAGILDGLRTELGDFRFCATGGHAEWVLQECGTDCEIVPELTLYGLARIYELNQ